MKTHLYRPNETTTMCGLMNWPYGRSTTEPFETDCLRCFMFYAHNVDWYWLLLGFGTPPGGSHYQRVDQPIFINPLQEMVHMTAVLNDNEEPDLNKEDAIDYLGTRGRERFAEYRVGQVQRRGQAWFNCLTVTDQDKLRGTYLDPFYKDNWADIIKALRFLLEN